MATLFQDVRFGIRGLIKNPAFALITILILLSDFIFTSAPTIRLS